MASMYGLLQASNQFYNELQKRSDLAESRRRARFLAVLVLQRMTRGYLIRKYVAWLSKNAITIQCAFRVHKARKAYRAALRRAVMNKDAKHYNRAATIIQALWRGYYSRRTQFCYLSFRRWLSIVKERGEKRTAEAAEFGIKSKADILSILEEEARQWIAYVVFKLHHLLRTHVCAGVFSDPLSTELSEFEKLLKSVNYMDYMKRLKRKYKEFVRKHRPQFSNKRLFPIIGDGSEYWYLSLPEMYELTVPRMEGEDNKRHLAKHYGSIHKKPFLWKKVRPSYIDGDRGPFKESKCSSSPIPSILPARNANIKRGADPRFALYVKYYKPEPALFDYVDYHINLLLARKNSIETIDQNR